ncbi:GNAT family N-acetyltransferase [Antarcticirhabdus aurantiaca]|uniref:GNAT family N-acetyltransferase n=1 Tax=Antarcticirhabdus aurantiaca TaxID=2606717 RepID=A0ACD4NSP7_9HYPH|nr:GNAT family N-acetyltransferase [Antarcticirhabdus aurantiaca]WAJ29903.1 GNAT family N-acetyltransferase [Jeongeuplla avenae]
MATTEAERLRQQAIVRRLEAAGFRAWPASSTIFDGTWAVRVTTSFPAKRLNSVNPLDPSDHKDIPERINKAARHFASFGRQLLFRQSPLAAPQLVAHLDAEGWSREGETLVMTADLETLDLSGALDGIPIRDPARYVEASLKVHERPAALRSGLTAILEAIRPEKGMFLRESAGGEALAVALVIHDNDLAGLLDVAVDPSARNRGIGRELITTALRFAAHRGAATAWVQVEADNGPSRHLLTSIGFCEVYRYVYRLPPGTAGVRHV